MKLKQGLMLRNVANTWVVVATGSALLDFNGMMTLNETGAFLWNLIAQEKKVDEMVEALENEYKVSKEVAIMDINSFISKLKNFGCLE